MPDMQLALDEGFEQDRVQISADGVVLVELQGVSTRHQIGHARSVDLKLPEGAARLSVRLPDRGLAGDWPLAGAPPPSLRASVRADGSAIDFTTEQARYM